MACCVAGYGIRSSLFSACSISATRYTGSITPIIGGSITAAVNDSETTGKLRELGTLALGDEFIAISPRLKRPIEGEFTR